MIPALPAKQVIKCTPTAVQIYQYDTSPLGDRQPVLLVHGLGDEYLPEFHWQHVGKYLTSSQYFQQHYKIYLARYDTKAPEKQVVEAFKPAIQELANIQKRPIIVVALSIAGSIIRNAMVDSAVERSISRVITLGTPFHGSPLLTGDWMRYSLLKSDRGPFYRFDRYVTYNLYFKFHSSLLNDYYWDNYDRQIPTIGLYKFKFPVSVTGVLSPPTIPPAGTNYYQSNDKIIAYAGYFKSPYDRRANWLFTLIHTPITFFSTTVPAHFGREHAALRALNYEIASVVQNQKTDRPIYALNDGIVPISSSLSLPPNCAANPNIDNPTEVAKLKAQINIRKARLFKNIDHVTFTTGYRPLGHQKEVPDLLSPDEKPRSIFAWLLNDISN